MSDLIAVWLRQRGMVGELFDLNKGLVWRCRAALRSAFERRLGKQETLSLGQLIACLMHPVAVVSHTRWSLVGFAIRAARRNLFKLLINKYVDYLKFGNLLRRFRKPQPAGEWFEFKGINT